MEKVRKIKNALISVTDKEGILVVAKLLNEKDITLYATSGTHNFLQKQGINSKDVAELTGFSSILGGRVKTLNPIIFGGILARSENPEDRLEIIERRIVPFDLLIVSLYNFEGAIAQGVAEEEIIENIDIGGVALLRAGAKNFESVFCIPGIEFLEEAMPILERGESNLQERKRFAAYTFSSIAEYDEQIALYFISQTSNNLRYGENPHQKGCLIGNLNFYLKQKGGKALSYNNLLDLDNALHILKDWSQVEKSVVIIKHNNPCGAAADADGVQALQKAWATDPESAFGGVIATHHSVDKEFALVLENLFFEILAAPSFEEEALKVLAKKKNRTLLQICNYPQQKQQSRSIFAGKLVQEVDNCWGSTNFKVVTQKHPSEEEIADFFWAEVLIKYLRSNAIAIVRKKQLLGKGCGQTSRVEAVRQAIAQAQKNKFPLEGAILISDAFFPFPDSIALAYEAGIGCIVQPGGSIRDKEIIDYCDSYHIAMVFTGIRHFLH
ncbi:MAG: bifunctional phosphoribosylaminoimidazolecarboxamide formyltransferase/IMP cyclohydrolase [Bacteroidia bacterium]|nr:bifunctional phosphoribosylaminoimidazolecarboxamide formyltransferase/IMP cyclohydrolase [Bacteroidia bacterium]MDW8157318.1 bifunctional phosphoribosylaminoimidazolecarboxamide formyltransferase/IMP cyclohydrolase [Bacteroidia bacterium]